MSKSIEELKALANQIKNATEPGENTAQRVGGLFADIVDYIAGEEPGPTPTPSKTIYYGFAVSGGKSDFYDMDSIEKGDSNIIEVTPHNHDDYNSLYIAVPSDMNVTKVVYDKFSTLEMKAPVTTVVDGKSYKFYETAEESGFETGDYPLEITVN